MSKTLYCELTVKQNQHKSFKIRKFTIYFSQTIKILFILSISSIILSRIAHFAVHRFIFYSSKKVVTHHTSFIRSIEVKSKKNKFIEMDYKHKMQMHLELTLELNV